MRIFGKIKNTLFLTRRLFFNRKPLRTGELPNNQENGAPVVCRFTSSQGNGFSSGGDDNHVKNSLSSLSIIRDYARQIDVYTENLMNPTLLNPFMTSHYMDRFVNPEKLVFWKHSEEGLNENDTSRVSHTMAVGETRKLEAADNFDIVEWNDSKSYFMAHFPQSIDEKLRDLAVMQMNVAFQMDMENDMPFESAGEQSDLQTGNEFHAPSIALKTYVNLDAFNEEFIKPLVFNALIHGTIEIDPVRFAYANGESAQIPELNDYVTSIAANICSVAMKRNFPIHMSRNTFATKADSKVEAKKERNPHIVCVRDGKKGCVSPGNAEYAPFVPKEGGSGGSGTRKASSASSESGKKEHKTSINFLMSCDAYARAIEEAGRRRAALKAAKDKNPCRKLPNPCGKPQRKKDDACPKIDPCMKPPPKKIDPCPKEDPCKENDPCKKPTKVCQAADPCKKADPGKKEDPCKKLETKLTDVCKKSEKKADPCTKMSSTVADPCKTSDPCKQMSSTATDPCKKADKKADPCKKMSSTAPDSCKKPENKADPCKKMSSTAADPCKKPDQKADPCKKMSSTATDPCKKADATKTDAKKEDVCKKFEAKKAPSCKTEDPCKKMEAKKEDFCKKYELKNPSACKKTEAKKEDPCKNLAAKAADPCKKTEPKKADPCKVEDPCKQLPSKKADPCKRPQPTAPSNPTNPCKEESKPKMEMKHPCKRDEGCGGKKKEDDSPCKPRAPPNPCKPLKRPQKRDPCAKKKQKEEKKQDPCKVTDPCKMDKATKDICPKDDPCKDSSNAGVCQKKECGKSKKSQSSDSKKDQGCNPREKKPLASSKCKTEDPCKAMRRAAKAKKEQEKCASKSKADNEREKCGVKPKKDESRKPGGPACGTVAQSDAKCGTESKKSDTCAPKPKAKCDSGSQKKSDPCATFCAPPKKKSRSSSCGPSMKSDACGKSSSKDPASICGPPKKSRSSSCGSSKKSDACGKSPSKDPASICAPPKKSGSSSSGSSKKSDPCGKSASKDPASICGPPKKSRSSSCGSSKQSDPCGKSASKDPASICGPPKKSRSSSCGSSKKSDPCGKSASKDPASICGPPKKSRSSSCGSSKKSDPCGKSASKDPASICGPPKKSRSSSCGSSKKWDSCGKSASKDPASICGPPKKKSRSSSCGSSKKSDSCGKSASKDPASICGPPKKSRSSSCGSSKKSDPCGKSASKDPASICGPPKKSRSSSCGSSKKSDPCGKSASKDPASICGPPKKSRSSSCGSSKKSDPCGKSASKDPASICGPPKKSSCGSPKKSKSQTSPCAPPKKSASSCSTSKKSSESGKSAGCPPPKKTASCTSSSTKISCGARKTKAICHIPTPAPKKTNSGKSDKGAACDKPKKPKGSGPKVNYSTISRNSPFKRRFPKKPICILSSKWDQPTAPNCTDLGGSKTNYSTSAVFNRYASSCGSSKKGKDKNDSCGDKQKPKKTPCPLSSTWDQPTSPNCTKGGDGAGGNPCKPKSSKCTPSRKFSTLSLVPKLNEIFGKKDYSTVSVALLKHNFKNGNFNFQRTFAKKNDDADKSKCNKIRPKYPLNRKENEKRGRKECFIADECPRIFCKPADKTACKAWACKQQDDDKKNKKGENEQWPHKYPNTFQPRILQPQNSSFLQYNQRRSFASSLPERLPPSHCGEDDEVERNSRKGGVYRTETIRVCGECQLDVVNEQLPMHSPYDVILRTEAVAISGSDVHVYETGGAFSPGVTLGHDASGVIEEVGDCVQHLQRGDRVAVESCISCGICDFCKQGLYNMCANLSYNGFLRHYQVHPADMCHKLPECMSLEEGTLVQTMALGCQICAKANITPVSNLLIIGACPTAVAAAMCALALGAKDVCIMSTNRLAAEFVGKQFGFNNCTYATDMPLGDIQEIVYSTMKELPNVVINCAISELTMNLSVMVLRPCGVCVLAECESECASFNALDVLMKNLKIFASYRSTNMYPTAIQLIENGQAPIGELIHRVYLWHQMDMAFRSAQYASNTGSRKIIVKTTSRGEDEDDPNT